MRTMFTVEAFAAELRRRDETKEDRLFERGTLFLDTGPETGVPDGQSALWLPQPLESNGKRAVRVNEHAHGQLATRLSIPKRYYDRMRQEQPMLLDRNVNTWLRQIPAGAESPVWLVRTLDGVCRALLSDRYRSLDNWDIASAVFPALMEIPDRQFRSCAITETHMHVKVTTPRLRADVVPGDTVAAGVYIGNSEVGAGALVIYPFIERLICSNGQIQQRRGEGMMRRMHIGRRMESDEFGLILSDETRRLDDAAFLAAVADVVHAAVDEARFHELVADMARAAASQPVIDVEAAVATVVRREGLYENEGHAILNHLAGGGDLTRWGMLNAITRTAQDVHDYDRSTALEMIGGRLVDYTEPQWNQVATATEATVRRRRRRSLADSDPDDVPVVTGEVV